MKINTPSVANIGCLLVVSANILNSYIFILVCILEKKNKTDISSLCFYEYYYLGDSEIRYIRKIY